MTVSRETLEVCLELLTQVVVRVAEENAVEKMQRANRAYEEIVSSLDGPKNADS